MEFMQNIIKHGYLRQGVSFPWFCTFWKSLRSLNWWMAGVFFAEGAGVCSCVGRWLAHTAGFSCGLLQCNMPQCSTAHDFLSWLSSGWVPEGLPPSLVIKYSMLLAQRHTVFCSGGAAESKTMRDVIELVGQCFAGRVNKTSCPCSKLKDRCVCLSCPINSFIAE